MDESQRYMMQFTSRMPTSKPLQLDMPGTVPGRSLLNPMLAPQTPQEMPPANALYNMPPHIAAQMPWHGGWAQPEADRLHSNLPPDYQQEAITPNMQDRRSTATRLGSTGWNALFGPNMQFSPSQGSGNSLQFDYNPIQDTRQFGAQLRGQYNF